MKQIILLALLLLGFISCSEDNNVCEANYPMDNNKIYRRIDNPNAGYIHFSKSSFIYTTIGGSFGCAYTYKHPVITLHYQKDNEKTDWPITVGENTLTLKDQEGNTIIYTIDNSNPQPEK